MQCRQFLAGGQFHADAMNRFAGPHDRDEMNSLFGTGLACDSNGSPWSADH
jgi:hypothetical protein